MSIELPVTGILKYNGLYAQQHMRAFDEFKKLLSLVKPDQILEIGTAGGGFTLFLREYLNEIGLRDSLITSFDIKDAPQYDKSLRVLNNISINIENIFDEEYRTIKNFDTINNYINRDGVTLVLCDGGNKISEFRCMAPLLKKGDIIMAHDYVDTISNFKENYLDKIWNWREIGYEHIENVCIEQNLIPFLKDDMQKAVWACFQKS